MEILCNFYTGTSRQINGYNIMGIDKSFINDLHFINLDNNRDIFVVSFKYNSDTAERSDFIFNVSSNFDKEVNKNNQLLFYDILKKYKKSIYDNGENVILSALCMLDYVTKENMDKLDEIARSNTYTFKWRGILKSLNLIDDNGLTEEGKLVQACMTDMYTTTIELLLYKITEVYYEK